jgi:alpha-1,6-mannosyltransferase
VSTVRQRRAVTGAGAGLIGTMLIAIASRALSYTGFGATTADSTFAVRWLGRGLGILGLALLTLGWWWVREVAARGRWLLLALWSLPLLFAPPVGSRDAYAYAEQGWLVAHGHDPYTTPMGSLGSPFSGLVDAWWRGQTTVYPPLALEVQSWVVRLTGESAVVSVAAQRVPAILGLVLVGLCLPRLARHAGGDPDLAGWLILINPLVVVHVVGGAHNDALAVGLAIAAVWLATARGSRGWLAGAGVLGLAAAVKQPMALGGLAIAAMSSAGSRRPWPQLLVRAVVVAVVGFAVFALVTLWSGLGWGWLTGSGSPYKVVTVAPASLIADACARLHIASFAGTLGVLGPVFLVLAALVILADAVRTLDTSPIGFLGRSLIVFALLSPALQVWYLLWGGVFLVCLPLSQRGPRRMLAVVVTGLAVLWVVEWVGTAPLWGALLAGLLGLVVLATPRRPTAVGRPSGGPVGADKMAP